MDYAQLQTDIAQWVNREDLSARIPTFIRLFEARASRELRTLEMVRRATATSDKQFIQLPLAWREAKNLQIGDQPLSFLPMEEMDRLRSLRAFSGASITHYSIVGRSIELLPTPGEDVQVEMTYYEAVPALSNDNPTNWLLTKHYDLYLNGSLAAAQPFLMEDERLATFEALTAGAIASINLESDRAAFSGSKLVARKRTFG